MGKKIKIPALSLNAKIEQFARFLRTEAQISSQEKTRKVVKAIAPTKILKNKSTDAINQVAEKLKDGVHVQERSKKRTA